MKTKASVILVWCLAATLLSSKAPTHTVWIPDGTPICTTTYNQDEPEILTDGAGGAFVVWTDVRSYDFEIYAQRITERATPLWGVNGKPICMWPDVQSRPEIVSDGAGGVIVVYHYIRNNDFNIFAQRFDADGNILWPDSGVAVADTTDRQENHKVTTDGAGGAIVAWEDARGDNKDIYVQRIGPDGRVLWGRNGRRISPEPDIESIPEITSDGAGGAVVVWMDTRNAFSDIYAQRIDANGDELWTGGGVPVCLAYEQQRWPNLTKDGAGGAIIAWEDSRTPGTKYIYAQRLDADGNPLWQADGDTVSTVYTTQFMPKLINDDAGGAIIAWYGQSGSGYDIGAQRLDAGGNRLWTNDGVEICSAPQAQDRVSVIPDGSGGAVFAWQDNRNSSFDDIYAQRVSPNGTPLWETDGVAVCTAVFRQQNVCLTTDGAGGAIFAWEDQRHSRFDIYGSLIDPNGQLVPALLQSYNADCRDGAAVIAWTVSDAANASRYTPYRNDGSAAQPWTELSVAVEGRGTSYSFTDASCRAGSSYRYRVDVTDESGQRTLFETELLTVPAVTAKLFQNVPNPFTTPATSLRYYLPHEAAVTLRVYDVTGRLTATLIDNKVQEAGYHGVEWSGRDQDGGLAASGMYFYRLQSGEFTATRKMVLLR